MSVYCKKCVSYHETRACDETPTDQAGSELASPSGSVRTEDLVMLIRRLCRVVARHDANNTVRTQALDYLQRKGLGGSPLKENAPNNDYASTVNITKPVNSLTLATNKNQGTE